MLFPCRLCNITFDDLDDYFTHGMREHSWNNTKKLTRIKELFNIGLLDDLEYFQLYNKYSQ